jgi:hypothetical protein
MSTAGIGVGEVKKSSKKASLSKAVGGLSDDVSEADDELGDDKGDWQTEFNS